MNDTVQIALITSIAPTLAAVVAAVIGWLNHLQGKEIHWLVNSNMSKVQADLAQANLKIEELERVIGALANKLEQHNEGAHA